MYEGVVWWRWCDGRGGCGVSLVGGYGEGCVVIGADTSFRVFGGLRRWVCGDVPVRRVGAFDCESLWCNLVSGWVVRAGDE